MLTPFLTKVFIEFEFNYSRTLNFFFALILPLLIYFVVAMVLICIEIIRKTKKYYKLMIAFIIINITIQPSLVAEGFNGADCVELYEKRKFITIDFSMECNTNDY